MLNEQELQQIRRNFPFFDKTSNSDAIIYLDNAATTQKLSVVIDSVTSIWKSGTANVHRSSHALANRLTERFEDARTVCRQFINAAENNEIIWTSGTTEAINLVANSWGLQNIQQGDQLLVTEMEHHANLIPWQQLCQRMGAELKIVPIMDSTELDLQALDAMLNSQVKLLAVTHVSNVLGTVNPIQQIVEKCRQYDCKVLVDGAQAIAHLPIDVQQLDCDFYVFSGHKCFATEGTGVLYAKKSILESMPPWKTGGEMVKTVDYRSATYQAPPHRFEAGTANISAIIALAEAFQFINNQDRDAISKHELDLGKLALSYLLNIKDLNVHSNVNYGCNIISMSVDGCQSMDIAALLDEQNIALRSGHLCAMPLVKKFNPNGILRVSFSLYNSADEVLTFINSLEQAIELIRG